MSTLCITYGKYSINDTTVQFNAAKGMFSGSTHVIKNKTLEKPQKHFF